MTASGHRYRGFGAGPAEGRSILQGKDLCARLAAWETNSAKWAMRSDWEGFGIPAHCTAHR
jgi:hypothetical protein